MMCLTSKSCVLSLLLMTCTLPYHIYDHYNCDNYDYRIPGIAIFSYYQHYDDYSYTHYDNDITFLLHISAQNVPSRAWFAQWQDYMNSSSTFRRLLENHMLPVLRGHTLLAFPDDARLRDKYAVLFSLEVILTLQRVEAVLRSVFCIKGHTEKPSKEGMKGREGMEEGDKGRSVSPMPLDPHHYWHHLMMPIIIALRRINLVPQVISEAHIMQLMKDVMPERVVKGGKRKNSEDFVQVNTEDWEQTLLFPHWEWIICVVAYEAMDVTVRVSSTATDPALIPSLVAKLIAAIATAMEASFSSQR